MTKRKSRLLNFDSLLANVKSAARYKQKMDELLTGTEYSSTVSSIDQLQNSIETEKRKIRNSIQDTEEQIAILELKVSRLQWEYNNYPEEVQVSEQ